MKKGRKKTFIFFKSPLLFKIIFILNTYYNNYFKADNEIHIIVNFTLNTTTRISVMGNLLDVAIMEYVDKEEHDAALACSGMLLAEYHVNIKNGEIEKIQ